jgi:hypothetical protein
VYPSFFLLSFFRIVSLFPSAFNHFIVYFHASFLVPSFILFLSFLLPVPLFISLSSILFFVSFLYFLLSSIYSSLFPIFQPVQSVIAFILYVSLRDADI